jgi:hypothetical protein
VKQIEGVSIETMGLISDGGLEAARAGAKSAELPLPGVDTAESISAAFKNSHALLVVSSKKTLLVAQPRLRLIGFRNLVNDLLAIDTADDVDRILVWIADLGGRDFENQDACLRFLNVEALVSRFKALKLFEDNNTRSRWNWLQSKAIIALRVARCGRNKTAVLPDYAANHVLLDGIPRAWAGSENFRALYGRNFERLDEANYSIFLSKSNGNSTPESSNINEAHRIICRGHALFAPAGRGDRQIRALELPPPGRSYEAAFKAIYVAANHLLGLTSTPKNSSTSEKKAVEELQQLGFSLFRLDEFINLCFDELIR